MRKNIFSILTFLPMVLLLVGCSEMDSVFNRSSKEVKMSAIMPGSDNTTRVGLSESSGTLNLITSWQEGDELLIYLLQDDEKFDVGKVPVTDISSDGKQANFEFTLPKGMDPSKSFHVYAFCSANGDMDKAYGNWDVFYSTDLIRTELSKFKAPLYGEAEMNIKSSGTIKFRHFNTYEVLHVKNATNADISFCHFGFETELQWYAARAGINFESDGDKVTLPSVWDSDCESETIIIPAGSTASIISCYLPSGFKMKDAYLQASINGSMVKSSNKKSSNVTIERGHAYHLYATWDGSELTFDNGDITTEKIIEVSPLEINFGTLAVDEGWAETFVVTNIGTEALTFRVEYTYGDFSIEESGRNFTLDIGEHMPFTVVFKPSEEDRPYQQSVAITSDAINGTQYLMLYGQSEKKRITQVIPDEIRDEMEPYIHIYDGANPPNIEGDYLMSPCLLSYDSRDGIPVGYQFNDVYLRFLNQDMVNNTLDFEEMETSSSSTGTGCFISGEGDRFSVFFNTEGIHEDTYTTHFKEALVISGIKTDYGIEDLEYAFVMVEKDYDPKPYMMAVGDFRVVIDGDGIAYNTPWSWARSRNGSDKKNINLPSIRVITRK